MKTYLIDGVYYGTQADAKAACKAQGVKFDADFHEENVPTDKDGLLAYVNRLSAKAQTKPTGAPAPAQGNAGAILDRMDRQHAENALREAQAAITNGLNLIKRKHSGEPATVEELMGADDLMDELDQVDTEGLMDDGPIAGDPVAAGYGGEDLMS